MISDQTILTVTGGILATMVGIIGFFIKDWMNNTDKRDVKRSIIIENISNSLLELNTTLNILSTSLKVYEANTNGKIANLEENVHRNSGCIDEHDKMIQDHEIRLTVIEKSKNSFIK